MLGEVLRELAINKGGLLRGGEVCGGGGCKPLSCAPPPLRKIAPPDALSFAMLYHVKKASEAKPATDAVTTVARLLFDQSDARCAATYRFCSAPAFGCRGSGFCG